jgi:hypothetical protein
MIIEYIEIILSEFFVNCVNSSSEQQNEKKRIKMLNKDFNFQTLLLFQERNRLKYLSNSFKRSSDIF